MSFQFRFPEWRQKALTFSYDDGPDSDVRLVSIFNQYGMKGTFHLNSGRILRGEKTPEQIRALYAGHEIACHGKNHATFRSSTPSTLFEDMIDDRVTLEKVTGYPVTGFSYPCGDYSCDPAIIERLKAIGIVYGRMADSTWEFKIPEDFMRWHASAHHNRNIQKMGKRLLEMVPTYGDLKLCYIWGHSFEFDRDQNWDVMENFCKMMSGKPELWYATNMQIFRYVTAMRSLVLSMDNSFAWNPTATPVFGIAGDDKKVRIDPGQTVYFDR